MALPASPKRTEGAVLKESIAKWLARTPKAFSVAEVSDVSAWIGTTVGIVRPENQDRGIAARFTTTRHPSSQFLCFALCDGMGGMTDGARCAEIALSSFIHSLACIRSESWKDRVRAAALAANLDVYSQYRERGGTTLVAIVHSSESSVAVSIGDSRIYEINARKELSQVSVDDTIAAELRKLNKDQDARRTWDTFAGQLAQFVGMGEGLRPNLFDLIHNQAHLLTSDGIHNMSSSTMRQIVAAAVTPFAAVSHLLQVSRWCGGTDNATAVWASPPPSTWATRPPWIDFDCLEIWDSSGKIELPFDPIPAALPRQNFVPKQVQAKERPSRRPKKGPTNKPRPARSSRPVSHRTSAEQRHLMIEIGDTKAADGNPSAANPEQEDIQRPAGNAPEGGSKE